MTDSLVTIAWRNLWRTRRRTWLTAGSIGFAIFIVVFARSAQVGTFAIMIDNATEALTGHLQLQHLRRLLRRPRPPQPQLRHLRSPPRRLKP